jgi:hypothetical protein
MPSDPKVWKSFIEWCEREIADREASVLPLESGEMHTGKRGPDTGFQWVDTTKEEAKRLRGEIASLRSTVDGVKQRLAADA